MKHLILAALVATSFAGVASAAQTLSEPTRIAAQHLVPSADLNNLTSRQVIELEAFFDSSENLKSSSYPAGQVAAIVGQN